MGLVSFTPSTRRVTIKQAISLVDYIFPTRKRWCSPSPLSPLWLLWAVLLPPHPDMLVELPFPWSSRELLRYSLQCNINIWVIAMLYLYKYEIFAIIYIFMYWCCYFLRLQGLVGTDIEYPEFDPFGLTRGISEEKIFWYRAAELKHGRVAMLAALGQLSAYFFRIGDPVFSQGIIEQVIHSSILITSRARIYLYWLLL